MIFGIFQCTGLSVMAFAASESDLTFELSWDGESYEITDCNESASGELVIPSEYNGLPVTRIGSDAFENCTSLESAIIPESVTEIQDGAFRGCTSLKSILIPKSVIYIDREAFKGCTSLESITIPESVTNMGSGALENCTSLESITIPDSVVHMSYDIFLNTAYYNNEDNWENGVLYIGNYLIEAKDISDSYVVKNGTKVIAGEAFKNCASLKSITIPDSVTHIGYEAFRSCTSLTSVTIPESVTYIDGGAFRNCTSLESITIPESVGGIRWRVFEGCTSLESVTIPEGIMSIEGGAFRNCTSLESITIPESVTYIEGGAFENCSSNLTIIAAKYSEAHAYALKDSINIIFNGELECLKYELNYNEGGYVVSDCFEAYDGELVIPSEYNGLPVTDIGDSAFKDCTGLESISIPESVTNIGDSAFENCTGLTSMTIPNSVTYIGDEAFCGCARLETITIPDSVTKIGSVKNVFENCNPNLTLIAPKYSKAHAYALNNSINIIFNGESDCLEYELNYNEDGYVVSGCFKAYDGELVIPSEYNGLPVTRIGSDAFVGCTGLTLITIPESVTYMGSGAFENCTSLESIKIPDSVTEIGYGAFQNCTSITSVTIPESVTYIGPYAFSECTSLESISIPDSATVISWGAFSDCTSLTSVTIPENVTEIYESAFSGCTNLTISGYKNSAAQKYAEEYGFAFNALGTVVADGESDIKVIGDVDENAALNVTLLNSDESKITYDITLTKDGKEIQPNGTVTVKIPVPEGLDGAKCRVYRAETDGTYTDVNAKFENGFMVFETTHFSEYVLTVDDLSVAYGDVNGDGKITAVDLAMLKKYLANRDPVTGESTVAVKKGADVNGDDRITAVDLAMLKKYLANRDPLTGESTVTLGPKK